VRFLPVWNPLMKGMITICSLPTALTIFINFLHSIFKHGPNVIIINKVKIKDKEQNNYYNT